MKECRGKRLDLQLRKVKVNSSFTRLNNLSKSTRTSAASPVSSFAAISKNDELCSEHPSPLTVADVAINRCVGFLITIICRFSPCLNQDFSFQQDRRCRTRAFQNCPLPKLRLLDVSIVCRCAVSTGDRRWLKEWFLGMKATCLIRNYC